MGRSGQPAEGGPTMRAAAARKREALSPEVRSSELRRSS